ncbi:MAG: choice-of-anchor J domain-containing protein, partial [bacterium]
MQKFVITFILVLSLPVAILAQTRVDWNQKSPERRTGQQSDFRVSSQTRLGVESFEGADFPPNGWQKFTQFGGTGWQRITVGAEVPGFQGAPSVSAPPAGGSFVAMASWLTGDADSLLSTGQKTAQWLITPQIKDVQAGDSLTFYLRYFSTFGDNLDILLSTSTPEDLDSSLVDTAVVPLDSVFTIPVDTLIFTNNSSNEWIRYSYH